MSKMKMILDLDTGIDDALAIAYAAASPEVDLIGITGTYGNVLMREGVANSLKILDLLGHSAVPVFAGLSHSQTTDNFKTLEISQLIHGKDGIGEIHLADSPRSVAEQGAVDFMLAACKTYGKELTIVATGPMTNLAAAIRQDKETMQKLGKIVIMGGALTVCGNVSPFAEANISQDPESADELFRSGLPITMVGLDVTLRTLLTKKETQSWRELGTNAGKAFSDMVDYYIKAYEITSPHLNGCALHDPLAVAVAINPDLLTTIQLNLKVETEGPSRGRTIGDNERLNDPNPNVTIGVNVAVERFVTEFMQRLTALFQAN